MLAALSGNRTYICAALLIIVEVLAALDILRPEVANSIEVMLGAGGLAALRAAAPPKK